MIGKVLVSELGGYRTSGRIVEVEAYLPGDPGSHAFRGKTRRNATMFEPRGHIYVYRIYGTSRCANVTSERRGVGAATLIRALEPLEGIEIMRERRRGRGGKPVADRDLVRGPGRLTVALGITSADDGRDLCARNSPIWLADDGVRPRIGVSFRIGLTKGAERKQRFYARGSRWLSGRRLLSP